jgi:hypothetical protein
MKLSKLVESIETKKESHINEVLKAEMCWVLSNLKQDKIDVVQVS